MSKVKLNPIIQEISGKMGDIVFRTSKTGKVTIAKRPDVSRVVTSQAQLAQRERFKQAVAYAKNAASTEPKYAELAERTDTTAYRLAFSDWCYPPVIHEVSRRSGRIRIDANDSVYVAKVRVAICDAAGNILMQGDAALVNDAWWEYETDVIGNVLVEVWDLAGNVARYED